MIDDTVNDGAPRNETEDDDPATMSEERSRATLLQQLPLLVALVLLWMMLWGSVTVLTVLTGLVVALLVTRAFYLPPVELSRRFNPLWAVAFLGRFFGELFVASFQVAALAFSPKGGTRSAIVRVQLRTRSDIIMTLTSITISLVPGSLVIEVDRRHAVLYVHVLGATTADDVEDARHHTLSMERQIIAAIGSKAEWEQVR
ncbi:MAG: Na+/H+ antiporter subunit E [Microcella sp.]|uniref:Na+/H+ antiporter subunit E n=1 Tax=Microcella sp. TaxID=1913979 RepID=UPI0033158780